MRRVSLTCQAARFIEIHLTAWADHRDEHGKLTSEARDRRQWNRIADQFVEAAGDFDTKVEAEIKTGTAFVEARRAEQSALAEQLTEEWTRSGVSPETIAAAVSNLRTLTDMRIGSEQAAINGRLSAYSDDPALGQKACDLDLDDDTLGFLVKRWDDLDIGNDRATRRLVNVVRDAFAQAVELERDGDRYVPKRPKLVEKAS